MAEDEMRQVHTLAIVFNCRKNSELYNDIFSVDTKTSVYLKELEDKRRAEDKKDPDEVELDELAARPNVKKKPSLKSSSITPRKEDNSFPYK